MFNKKKHNIVIVGAGEIGKHIALRLSEEKHFITVIESDEAVAKELGSQIDGRVIAGDGTDVDSLFEADIAEADFFIALTSDNNVNQVSSAMAKKLGAGKVFCRVHPDLERTQTSFNLRENFDIDYIFSSERLAAAELSKSIRNPESVNVEELAAGNVELQRVRVSPKSEARGKTLRELDFPDRVRIGGIIRNGKSIVVAPDETLLGNDEVIIFGEPKRLHDVIIRLNHNRGKEAPPKVIIFGGGDYGFSLTKNLEGSKIYPRIFEASEKRCEEIRDLLADKSAILNYDATVIANLKEENIEEVDYFVATTEMDQDNVMTCLQARTLGAKKTITLIHRADYAEAITKNSENMGIMAAVSPREATLNDLRREMTSSGNYHRVNEYIVGDLILVTVAENSIADGKKVSEVKWPTGCVLVALGNSTRATTPAADDDIKKENQLFALVPRKTIGKFLKLIK
ncbi:MAG: Trk system potassium transporter TrkA [Verrucomicrobiales bacterium]|nr:Trk system potassium transporter TrkA [Verrucomicrobiales bacterium]